MVAETDGYTIQYVDDITQYSPSFEDHLEHLQVVLGKLTRAGFTLNLENCKFFQHTVKFLGHIVDRRGISPDPDRIAAIRRYPAPRNQKQLRQFLGVCNYHSKFIVKYADYVAPLQHLLKKGSKWAWSAETQSAFEAVRAKFAEAIQLLHPSEKRPFAIFTDASGYAIGGVLTQERDAEQFDIISTASRVFTQTETLYYLRAGTIGYYLRPTEV
jgi:hypothetical protein